MFLPSSRYYVSTDLEVCFDRARGMFRPCSRYVSTVLEVLIVTVLEVCFDHGRPNFDIFRPCLRYVSTGLELRFYRRRGIMF